jgi:hypothetical protein
MLQFIGFGGNPDLDLWHKMLCIGGTDVVFDGGVFYIAYPEWD